MNPLVAAITTLGGALVGWALTMFHLGRSEAAWWAKEYRRTISRAAKAAREGQDGLAEILTESAARILEHLSTLKERRP